MIKSMNLEKSVETRKSTQVLNMPKKAKKELLTNKVGRFFVASLFTSITCTSFSRSTEFSRVNGGLGVGYTVLNFLFSIQS